MAIAEMDDEFDRSNRSKENELHSLTHSIKRENASFVVSLTEMKAE